MTLKQHDAVVEAMRANGGYATLGYLYREALKVPGIQWETKTPFGFAQKPRKIYALHKNLA
jgi:hypothetical protein